jgi:[ribosomal protein S18]-alanine N-acetyltransferase
VIIRRALPADQEAVLRIEQQSMLDPWAATQVAAELVAVNGIGWVAEMDGSVCGYVFFRICAPESELLRLAVAPSWRRKGVGRLLVDEALFFLKSQQGCDCCFLEVRAANEEAQGLYLRLGFVRIGQRKAYYTCGSVLSG